MPTTLQNLMIGEELFTAVRLLKSGLRELNRIDGATDFFHMPILLLASGFERMMKTAFCCHYLEKNGEYPDGRHFSRKPRGPLTHDLMWLLDNRVLQCFSDEYLARVPAVQTDVIFLRTDRRMRRMTEILSAFAKSARYYNLNVVFGYTDPGPSPNDDWSALELEILQEDPSWVSQIGDPAQSDAIHREINRVLTVQSEKLARALARLFSLGGLGEQAKKISPCTNHFLCLMNNQLGQIDYESIQI